MHRLSRINVSTCGLVPVVCGAIHVQQGDCMETTEHDGWQKGVTAAMAAALQVVGVAVRVRSEQKMLPRKVGSVTHSNGARSESTQETGGVLDVLLCDEDSKT